MKKNIILSAIAVLSALVLSSCVQDLNVKPIDPNLSLPEDVLNSVSAYEQVLAKCYQGLSCSSSSGPDGSADIDGIDGGFGQYMRALFYNNELPTDEASVCWNDKTIYSLHGLNWTTSDVFVTAMFSRIYYQISLCNEFIRRAKASSFADDATMKQYIAEARALRALSYYHAIDMFGNVPFATEANSVGSTGPDQISRKDLYDWLVTEITDFTPSLPAVGANEYGRANQALGQMLLAKLYLNSEVYTSGAEKDFDKCITVCKTIISEYPTLQANYQTNFMADNNKSGEIIFAAEQDGVNTQSYGATNFLIKASIVSGNAAWQDYLGTNDGWGGLVVTPTFLDKFDTAHDTRYLFFDGGSYVDDDSRHTRDITDYKLFKYGYTCLKFTNRTSDGGYGSALNFPDTDYPIFRAADAYLMLPEAELRANGSVSAEGLAAYNKVHTRAGLDAVNKISLDDILDERGRELYWENFRRSDLIRFGKFTTNDYLWQWKGGVYEGQAVDSHFNLMPIPASEVNANSKLTQNAGY